MGSIDSLMVKIGALRQVQEVVAGQLKAEIRADITALMQQPGLQLDQRSWQDLVGSSDPVFLNEAADLADSYGRTGWGEAMRESADTLEHSTLDN